MKQKKNFERAKKGAWAIVPKQVWLDCSHSELCVYNAISYLQGSNEYTWAGLDIISGESGYSVSACDKAIRSLIKLGWVGRIKQYGKPSKLFVYMDYIPNDETRYKILEAKHKANYEFKQKMKDAKDRKKLTNLQNPSESNLQNLSDTVLQNPSESIYQHHLPTTDYQQKVCANHDVLNNIEKTENLTESAKDSHTLTSNRDIIRNNALNQREAHTNHTGVPKVAEIFPDSLKIDSIDNSAIEHKYELQIRDINTKYDNILGQVPKLTTTELIGNSEKLLQTLGIGFDDNPRRILNKIYNSLPDDHRIMEDSKDIEVVKDFIAKYKSANPETRSALSKRLYQALELMVKIYFIKKFGEEFRGKLYPEILDKNLVLYLNCNPTLKYCFGGFSNDIDGVYDEVKRLIDKKNKKILDEIQEEKQKELARLEAYRKAEEYNSIPESERIAWQNRLHNIMTRKNRSTETLEVVRCRTHEEEMELNRLREMTAEMFRNNIKPEPWIRERVAELSTMRGYYGD